MSEYEDEDKTVRTIQELGVDTVVLAWWPKIVHKINKLGINVINTHPSYLPYNRGKHPYYWALVDGTPFGATIHRVDDSIDTGEILWQKRVQLDPTDTGETAYKKAADAMLQLLIEHAEDIAIGRFPPGIKQDCNIANHHFARELDIPPITSKMESALINDLRARTFNNKQSGRKIVIDGITYRIHLNLVQE
jgi:methionyl-tRNA formyltransferase